MKRYLLPLIFLFVAMPLAAQIASIQLTGNTSPTVNSIETYSIAFYDVNGNSMGFQPGSGYFTLVSTGVGTLQPQNSTSASVQWTVIGGSYVIECEFHDNNGHVFYADLAVYVVQGIFPQAPYITTLTNITATGFALYWNESPGATGYQIERAANSTFSNSYLLYVGATNNASMDNLSAGTTYYIRMRAMNGSSLFSPYSETYVFRTVPAVPTALDPTSVTESTFTANWTPVTGITNYYVYVGAAPDYIAYSPVYGPATVPGIAVSLTVTGLEAGTTYRYWVKAGNESGMSSYSGAKTVTTLPLTVSAPIATAASNIAAKSFRANWNPVSGATSYRLEVSSSPDFVHSLNNYDNILVTSTSQDVSGPMELQPNTTFYYRVRAFIGTRTSVHSNTITVRTATLAPVATAATDFTTNSFVGHWNPVTGATSYLADLSTTPDFSTILYAVSASTTTQAAFTSLQQKTKYYYRVRAYNSASVASANSNTILAVDLDMNYVRTTEVMVDGMTTEAAAESAATGDQMTVTSFYDGLGRPAQTVAVKESPLQQDKVLATIYDSYGREMRRYPPVITLFSGGWYNPGLVGNDGNFAGTAASFYSAGGLVATDASPYAETIFEPSPLNRVLKQGAEGQSWQPAASGTYAVPLAADHSIKKSYEYNGASEVILLVYNKNTKGIELGNTDYYGKNQLRVDKTKDEHNYEVIEYVDKEGHTILRRVETQEGGTTVFAETYYIYDDLGNLVTVLPPEATKRVKNILIPQP